jgi:serine carboxypeptidase 1
MPTNKIKSCCWFRFRMAATVQQQIAAGQFASAWSSWNDLLQFIDSKSASVDVYNFLLDSGMDPVTTTTAAAAATASNTHVNKYSRYLSSQDEAAADANTIGGIMNGVVKQKLKIIPTNLTWQELSNPVYSALLNDFMKPRIDEIDELLSYGVNVTVYNGQVIRALHLYCPRQILLQ